MEWICQECGSMNNSDATACICGFHQTDSASTHAFDLMPEEEQTLNSGMFRRARTRHGVVSSLSHIDQGSTKTVVAEKLAAKRHDTKGSEPVTVKEIGSWKFTYSPSDGKISIGTPALQPFCLTITVDDLQAILESIYEKTGAGKTLRKLELPKSDVVDLVEFIDEMIDAKRSRMKLTFSPEELEAITNLVNKKLAP